MTAGDPNPTVEVQDAVLIARVLDGSANAFEPLVRRYLPVIQGFMLNRLGPGGPWDDLVQETFVAAYRDLPRLRKPERFGPWLVRIAKSKLADHRRARRWDDAKSAEAANTADPRVTIGDSLTRTAILNAVAQLPDRYRVVVYMHLFAEEAPAEIATRLGINESTARTRLQRGLEKLRGALRREGITRSELTP